MTREQAINYLISRGLTQEQVGDVVRALTYKPRDCANCTHYVVKDTRTNWGSQETTKIYGCECWECEYEPTTKNDLVVDCISRKAAEDITWQDPSYTDPLNILTEVRDKIRELPSVTPQESKTGHWIEYTRVLIPEPFNKWEQAWYCSECGYGNQESDESAWLEWNYCPKCGAKMEVEDGNGKRK